MTYVSNAVLQQSAPMASEPFMALVDEYGQETPFNEYDIQRSLDQLAKQDDDKPETLNLLMDRVLAARAIA
ncbi:MAG: hypothetical protein OEY36_11400 [Gammaproteobacteria bacterium]|nr:hypothetical protein [Gammaproteobacteria bacterium]